MSHNGAPDWLVIIVFCVAFLSAWVVFLLAIYRPVQWLDAWLDRRLERRERKALRRP